MTDNRTTELRKALDFMRIWISDDAHLGDSEFSYELEKAEGLRKLEAIEQAIAATLGGGTCEVQHVKSGAMYDVWRYTCCGYEHAESVSEEAIPQNFCPKCGRKVVSA